MVAEEQVACQQPQVPVHRGLGPPSPMQGGTFYRPTGRFYRRQGLAEALALGPRMARLVHVAAMPAACQPAPIPRWWVLVGLPATIWLLLAFLDQPVDPANRALKALGTPEAAAREQLAGVVPSEQVVLLAYCERGEQPILPTDAQQLATDTRALRQLSGVLTVDALPAPQPNLRLYTVQLDPREGLAERAHAVVATAVAACPPSLRCLATGLPLLEARLAEMVAGERQRLVPALVLVLFAAAWLVHRRVGVAVATILPALLAIVWTGGIVAALGHTLDPIAALLEPVLLTIGVATAVHYVAAWRSACRDGLSAPHAAAQARRKVLFPALLATATTMLGLLAFVGNTVPAVADFGVRAALGLGLLHVAVFTVLPAWLSRLRPDPALDPGAAADTSARAARWLAWLQFRRVGLVALAASATVLAAAALPALRADNDPLALLPTREPCRAAYDELAARLGGVETFHLLAAAGSPAADPVRLLPFVAALQTQATIAGPAGPLLRTIAGDLAMPLLLRPGGSHVRNELFRAVEHGARACGLDGLVPAGLSVQIARDSERLVHSVLASTLATVVMLAIGMCLGLRSLRLGLLALVPTLLPCVWIYGGLALGDRPIGVATGMIACTMLGLLVDNAAHLLHHFARHRQTHPDAAAMTLALQEVGSPMVLSSAMLGLGFACAGASELASTVEFAWLAVLTIALALLATGALLPLLAISSGGTFHHAN